MSVTVQDNKYVVVLPDYGVRQDFNPDTRAPFATSAEALAWETAFTAGVQAAAAAQISAATAATQAELAAQVRLELTSVSPSVQVGAVFSMRARVLNGLGAVRANVNRTFDLPFEDDTGSVKKLKRITLVNGDTGANGSVTMTFTQSGYYRLSDRSIRSRMQIPQMVLIAPLEVVVWE